MHTPAAEDEQALEDIRRWISHRLTNRRDTLPPRSAPGPLPAIGNEGLGMASTWAVLRDDVLPTAVPSDHPRYLSFVPQSPSVAAVLADLVVSASAVYAGGTLDAGLLIAAERAALRWLADLAGMPVSAHGAFVSGGTSANLSALVAARYNLREVGDSEPAPGSVILTGTGAHSSIGSAARVMGVTTVAAGDDAGRLDGAALSSLISKVNVEDVIAVVATAGATNNGAVDDLQAVAAFCRAHGLWMHVDAAYGGGALLSPRTRPQFDGIESCDSITIDPHKWLFTPYDCGAVIYRDAERARRAHAQSASYLTAYAEEDNPADYAIHLSRRARGIPLWASLVANGSDAYRAAVERCLELADYAAARVAASGHLTLVGDPALSVVLLQRIDWTSSDYEAWTSRALASGLGLVTSTRHDEEPTLRFCFVNPLTTEADIDDIIHSLR